MFQKSSNSEMHTSTSQIKAITIIGGKNLLYLREMKHLRVLLDVTSEQDFQAVPLFFIIYYFYLLFFLCLSLNYLVLH